MKLTIEDAGVSVTVEGDDRGKLLQILAVAVSFVAEAPVIVSDALVTATDTAESGNPGVESSAETTQPAETTRSVDGSVETPPARQRRKRRTKAQIVLDNAAQAWSDGTLTDPTDEVTARAEELGLTPPPPAGTPDVTAPPLTESAQPAVPTADITADVTETAPEEPKLQVVPDLVDTITESIINVSAEDFEGVGKRRDIVRTIMKKGVTALPDIIRVCESLKSEVKLLGMLGDIPPAITAAFEAVQAENGAS